MSTNTHRRNLSLLLASITIFISLADEAAAWGIRRGRFFNNATSSGSGATQVAPKMDRASQNYRKLNISYHYDLAMSEDEVFQDRIRVCLFIDDKEVLERSQSLVAEVKITDVSDYQAEHVRFVPVIVKEATTDKGKRTAYFDVVNEQGQPPLVEPSKVYRCFINLHGKAEKQTAETVVGRVSSPYYSATSGDTRLAIARRRIVMRTFKEFYFRQNGWRSDEKYSIDCYAYYMWATGFCTVGAQNGRTRLHKLFGRGNSYNVGSQIPKLVKETPIHGDYVRQPGHSFMLLSYDEQRNQVWTMEGNFNSTIEVVIRSVGSGWQVGHLRDQHIRPEIFNSALARVQSRS